MRYKQIVKKILIMALFALSFNAAAEVVVDFNSLPYVEDYWMLPAKEIEQRAVAGDPFAQSVMSQIHEFGVNGYLLNTTLKNSWDEKAQAGFEQLAAQGNAAAQHRRGIFYVRKENEDLNKAISYCKRSADQGYVLAQYTLAKMYERKEMHNAELSVYWYQQALPGLEQAAKEGRKPSGIYSYYLSSIYKKGQGITPDDEKAKYWQNQYIKENRKYIATYQDHAFDAIRALMLIREYKDIFERNADEKLLFKSYALFVLLE